MEEPASTREGLALSRWQQSLGTGRGADPRQGQLFLRQSGGDNHESNPFPVPLAYSLEESILQLRR